jgi:serine/threonine protein kinase/WD40 repeat protein
MPSLIGQTVSHYKILEHLGGGGMGVVYKAQDLKLDRPVALKFLPPDLTRDPDSKQRFILEAKAASALDHPNICNVHDISETEDGHMFIVMACYEGQTLKKKIEGGPLALNDALDIVVQVALGLSKAHQHGIVHRDIKPANVMVTAQGEVKILDFGLAKLSGISMMTKTGSTVGTVAYMSPEQARGEKVDQRTDLWSLGVMLYQMITGELPFRSDYEQALVYGIMHDEPKGVRELRKELPESVELIIRRLLEKDPANRYASADDLVADLLAVREDNSARVSTTLSRKKRRSGFSRKSVIVGGIVASLLVAVGISVLLLVTKTKVVKLNPNRESSTLELPFSETSVPSISRDGNWVIFAANDDSGKWDIYWMSLSGREPSRITREGWARIDMVDLSPDAAQIAYNCIAEDGDLYQVRTVPLQGGASRLVVENGFVMRWAPDGKRIGYVRGGQFALSDSKKFELWSVKPDGSDNRREFTDTLNTYPLGGLSFSWSPNGASVAWVRNLSLGYGVVMVRELATGGERQLTSDTASVDEVSWTTRGYILYVCTSSGHANLWAVPSAGGEATQVTEGAAGVITARISSDNRKLLYVQRDIVSHIWISDLGGRNARQVTFDNNWILPRRFSPDGNHIAFVLGTTDGYVISKHRLFEIDRLGKNRRGLTSGSEYIGGYEWSPDGKWIAYLSFEGAEPSDSDKVYLLQPFNLSAPILLCGGTRLRWIDNENLLVFRGMKTWWHSTKGGEPVQYYRDSTFAVPIDGGRRIFYEDLRKGREGYWIVSADSARQEMNTPRRTSLPNKDLVCLSFSPDMRWAIYQTSDSRNIWRLRLLPRETREMLGIAPLGLMMRDVSWGRNEILWVKWNIRTKLALVEDLFEE